MSQIWDQLALAVVLASALALGAACSAESTPTHSRTGTQGTQGDTPGSGAAGGGGETLGNPAPTQTILPPPSGNAGTLTTSRSTAMGDACEIVQLVAEPVIPEMMIVLDRSGSMNERGRWKASVAAVRNVTQELQTKIHFGLALFPDPDAASSGPMVDNITDCFRAPDPQQCIDDFNSQDSDAAACAAGKVVVPVAANSADMVGSVLDRTNPFGGTPTSDTLSRILSSYGEAELAPDDKPHPKFVLLVTDGMPTCPNGHGSDVNQADIDASNAAIEALAASDVRTYVIGYDTAGPENEMLASVLDGFAQRGGTGDTMHRTVEDEASLLAELTRITYAIASCTFELDSPPERADHVLVRIDGQQVNLDEPDGFGLVGDHTVELRGESCTRYREGNHVIDAQVLCEIVQPQ